MTDADRPLNLDAETSFERDGCAHTALICMNCQREQHNAETLLAERDALIAELRAAWEIDDRLSKQIDEFISDNIDLTARAVAAEARAEAAGKLAYDAKIDRDSIAETLNAEHSVDLARLKRIEAAAWKWRGVPAGTIHGPEVTAAMLELFEAMDRAALSPAEEGASSSADKREKNQ